MPKTIEESQTLVNVMQSGWKNKTTIIDMRKVFNILEKHFNIVQP